MRFSACSKVLLSGRLQRALSQLQVCVPLAWTQLVVADPTTRDHTARAGLGSMAMYKTKTMVESGTVEPGERPA